MRTLLALILISVFLTGCEVLIYGATAAGGGTRTLIRDLSKLLPPVDEGQSRVFFFGDNTRYISWSEDPWEPKLNINGHPFNMKYGTLIAFCIDMNPGPLVVASKGEEPVEQLMEPGETYYIHMQVSGKKAETYRLGFLLIEPPIAKRMIKNHTFTGETLVAGSIVPFRCLARDARNYI